MNAQTQSFILQGAAGPLECKLDLPPEAAPRGIALIAHPHPLYGGTLDNKVVQTLARAFIALGYVSVRMNFRGVGESGGTHDNGHGETDDMAQLHAHMCAQYPGLPVALSGFSFGPSCSRSYRSVLSSSTSLPSGWCWSAARRASGRCLRFPQTPC